MNNIFTEYIGYIHSEPKVFLKRGNSNQDKISVVIIKIMKNYYHYFVQYQV